MGIPRTTKAVLMLPVDEIHTIGANIKAEKKINCIPQGGRDKNVATF